MVYELQSGVGAMRLQWENATTSSATVVNQPKHVLIDYFICLAPFQAAQAAGAGGAQAMIWTFGSSTPSVRGRMMCGCGPICLPAACVG